MADYRLGKFDEAIDWLKKAEANPELSAVLTAQLFEAMSHFRAGRQEEGICQIARREAEKLMK